MAKRLIIWLVVGVVLVGGAFAYKMSQKSGLVERERNALVSQIAERKMEAATLEYIRWLAPQVHTQASKDAFTGSGLTGGTFSVPRYRYMMIERMMERAASEKRDDVVKALRNFRANRDDVPAIDPADYEDGYEETD